MEERTTKISEEFTFSRGKQKLNKGLRLKVGAALSGQQLLGGWRMMEGVGSELCDEPRALDGELWADLYYLLRK